MSCLLLLAWSATHGSELGGAYLLNPIIPLPTLHCEEELLLPPSLHGQLHPHQLTTIPCYLNQRLRTRVCFQRDTNGVNQTSFSSTVDF